jgi:hypothetical protein
MTERFLAITGPDALEKLTAIIDLRTGEVTDALRFAGAVGKYWEWGDNDDLVGALAESGFSIPESPRLYSLHFCLMRFLAEETKSYKPPSLNDTYDSDTGKVSKPLDFVSLIYPHWRSNGKTPDDLGHLLAENEFSLPSRGPGRKSLANAISRYRRSLKPFSTTPHQNRQKNLGMRDRFSNGRRIS